MAETIRQIKRKDIVRVMSGNKPNEGDVLHFEDGTKELVETTVPTSFATLRRIGGDIMLTTYFEGTTYEGVANIMFNRNRKIYPVLDEKLREVGL